MRPLLLLLLLAARAGATHYYVSTAGSDSNNGTSTGTSWQTVSKVNAGSYSAGDTISFNGGDTFSGTTLAPTLVGSAGNVITVNSYGAGVATISVGPSCGSPASVNGISLTNASYVTITNINFLGSGWTGSGFAVTVCNGGAGIYLLNNTTSGTKKAGITISSVNVSGFFQGIWLDGGKAGSASTDGFDTVLITGSTVSDNLAGGILIQGYHTVQHGPVNQNSNVTVTNNVIQRIPGDPNSGTGGVHGGIHTESWGINVGNTTTATITGNIVTDIAGFGGASSGLTFGGSTAIVFANGRSALISHNEVGRTKCSTHYDGGAIDLDQDVQSSEVSFNLTYNNVGPAVELGSFDGVTTNTNNVHHNISYNDARGNNTGGTSEQGAFEMWGNVDAISFWNNTVYLDIAGTAGVPSCLSFGSANAPGTNSNIAWVNNVCQVTGGIAMVEAHVTTFPAHLPASLTVLGNAYDATGGSLLISNDNGSSYTSITTLAAWRALGYEVHSMVNYGVAALVYLRNLSAFSPPNTGFTALAAVANFDLSADSSALSAGIDPSVASITLGATDYHGNPSSRSGPIYDAGAVSFVGIKYSQAYGRSTLNGLSTAR